MGEGRVAADATLETSFLTDTFRDARHGVGRRVILHVERVVLLVEGLRFRPGAACIVGRAAVCGGHVLDGSTEAVGNLIGDPESAAQVLPHAARREGVPKATLLLGVGEQDLLGADVAEAEAIDVAGVSVQLAAVAPHPLAGKDTGIKLAATAEQGKGGSRFRGCGHAAESQNRGSEK